LVVLAQFHLLWVAVLHQHEAISVPGQVAAVEACQPHLHTGATDSGLLCTACQIVRHSAARPAQGTRVPESKDASISRPVISSGTFYSHQPTALFGRAPPLS
jgi:hypothetical protein